MIPVTEPTLVYRPEQSYVGIRKQVRMKELGSLLPPLTEDVFAWLDKKGLQSAGAPFWRYLIVDMERKLEIDVGIPVAERVRGEGCILADTLPAGMYAMLLHTGHPDELEDATAQLLAWAEEKDIRWKMDGPEWQGRVEWYYSTPEIEPDMTKWETELAFLTEES
jgi:effector-binding domain-containing protein